MESKEQIEKIKGVNTMEYLTLNTGAKMPLEGFGVFQIPDAQQCEQVVYDAIKTGYRLLDTAAAYMNEEALGKGVARAIADGLTTREELFITTKVWVQDQKTEETAYEAVKASLARLNLSYVDLVLLHQPMGDYFAAYRGIEKAYRGGLTKAVGVANFYPAILANLCENVEIIPAVNQVELHPFFVQESALENMKAYGVVPQAWGPLAEGKHGIFTDPQLTAIGQKHGKSAAQVVLRWNAQRGVSIIPKSVHVERMEQNIDIWDFQLSDEEMAAIASKDLGHSEIVNHDDPAFVKMLREQWGNEDMPFYFTQIAPYEYENPDGRTGGYMMWAQAQTLAMIPHSGMATTHDAGEKACIHPAEKKKVGDRLAFLALSNDYGIKGFDPEAPIFSSVEFLGDVARVKFDVGNMGLSPINMDIPGFELAGEDHVFHPATARISRDKSIIEVKSPDVKSPVAVRYGMRNWSEATLFNCYGIPASPFRSDNWE